MKYIRTKDGIFEFAKRFDLEHYKKVGFSDEDIVRKFIRNGNKIADTIEELIQIGDIVFYWSSSDDKEHCVLLNYDTELHSIEYNAITKLLIPVGEDYKCVAKGFPSFNVIKGRRYLVSTGELELL